MLEISKIVMFLIKKIYFLKNFFMIKETMLNSQVFMKWTT